MSAELTVDLPWIESWDREVDELVLRRGPVPLIAYSDGITLAVDVIDPARHDSAEGLLLHVRSAERPGHVVLVAGSVPLAWRDRLRLNGVSFLDVSGVAEIDWPRLRVSERRFGKPTTRRRPGLTFQKGHGVVVEELLILSTEGTQPTIGQLAERAGVSMPTASKAITKLAEHGLVTKRREGNWVTVEVRDRSGIAARLADRTSWPGEETLSGFLWGRTIFDVAARLSRSAEDRFDLAVSGRVGAAFHGVLGTSSPRQVRAWLDVRAPLLTDAAEHLGLEPASEESANVVLSADTWRVGVHRARQESFDEFRARVAHPLRVWCDVQSESRGPEFAAQLWSVVLDGG